MKKNQIIFMATLVVSVLLTGCQQVNQQRSKYIRDRERDYLASTVIAPLKVPADLSYLKGQEHYQYPHVLPHRLQEVSLVPPGFGELSQS